MGSKNRERRAAKQKARDRRRGYDGGRGRASHPDSDTVADGGGTEEWAFGAPRWSPELVSDVVLSMVGEHATTVAAQWRAALVDPRPADLGHVHRGLDLALARPVELLWQSGWLPVDAVEHLRRQVTPSVLELAIDAVATQVARYAQASLHPRWWESVLAAEVGPERRSSGRVAASWAARHGVGAEGLLDAVLSILRVLHGTYRLPTIVPPPGSAPARDAASQATTAAGIDPKVLARVRGLLAKAESTSYPEEAEALSAKAQELMNRYALEQAVVEGVDAQDQAVVTVRMWLEAPYVAAKGTLVNTVADANRCRAVAHTGTDMVSIVGHVADLDVVQVLVTSLLVQASRAMVAEGRATAGGGRTRSRSFRQSFLVAYAGRIGERLRDAATGAASAVDDDRLLPVLTRRASAVDDTVDEVFGGDLTSKHVSIGDAAGYHAGRAAADTASLTLERDRIDR